MVNGNCGEDPSKSDNFLAPYGIWGNARADFYIGELPIDGLRRGAPTAYLMVHKPIQGK